MRGLLIALLFVPIGCSAFIFPWTDVGETEVEFEVDLVCHYFENYKYQAWFFETDSILSDDDIIVASSLGTPGKIETTFRANGSVEGDEMQSSAYTFRMLLIHNCAYSKSKELRSKVFIHPPCPIGSKLCQYKIRVHITDLEGDANVDSKIDVIPPKPEKREERALEPVGEPLEPPAEKLLYVTEKSA